MIRSTTPIVARAASAQAHGNGSTFALMALFAALVALAVGAA